MFVTVMQYIGGNKFKGDVEMESNVTRWVPKKDTDRYRKEGRSKARIVRKMNEKEVQLNLMFM